MHKKVQKEVAVVRNPCKDQFLAKIETNLNQILRLINSLKNYWTEKRLKKNNCNKQSDAKKKLKKSLKTLTISKTSRDLNINFSLK